MLMNKLSFNQQKTFRPKVSIWPNNSKGRFALAGQLSDSAVLGVDLRQAVVCPPDYDLNEWFAINMVDFFNQINLIYGNISEFCTPTSCPVMNAGPKYDYLWADGVVIKKPVKCAAPEYVARLLEWVQSRFDDHELFPRSADTPFPPHFFDVVKTVFKRLFRVYAHMYYSHYKNIDSMGQDAVLYLNTCYKHFILFIFRYSLVDRKELEPLAVVNNQILSSEDQLTALSHSPSFMSSTTEEGSTVTRGRPANLNVRAALVGSSEMTKPLVMALKKVLILPLVCWAPNDIEAKELAALTGIHQTSTEIGAVISRPDIDVLFVSAPVKQRKALFLAAVGASKHVIVEHPIALNRGDMLEMLAAVNQSLDATSQGGGVVCFTSVNFPLRYLPTSRRMRGLFFKDYCGELVSVRAQLVFSSSSLGAAVAKEKSSGPWTERRLGADFATLVDLIFFVTGLTVNSVTGHLRTSVDNAYEGLMVQGLLESVPVSINVNHGVSGPDAITLELFGSRGTLVLHDLVVLGCQAPTMELSSIASSTPSSLDVEEDAKSSATAAAGGLVLMARALRALVIEKDDQIVRDAASLEDALYVQTVLDAVKQSVDNGNRVEMVAIPESTKAKVVRSMSREDVRSTE